MTHRHALTDAQWTMVSIVVPKRRGPKATLDDRIFIDAVLYRAKTGMPWRDLPERFGSWKTVFNRFSNWSRRGHWAAIFKALQLQADDDGVIIDASVVRAHQDAAGGKGDHQECTGSFSRWVLHQDPRPRRHETAPAPRRNHARPATRVDSRGEAFIADTGYDSDAIRAQLKALKIKPVIHANPTRKRKPRLDRRRYAQRYRVEIFFHDLKRFRALATRFEKTA